MNKAILAGVALVATAASVCAQGTLSLSTATGTKPRVTLDGVNVVTADNIWLQVLVGGATSLTGTDTFQLTLAGANAGLFSKGVLTVGGKAGGSAVDVTIRAWDKDTAATYDAAPDTARASVTLAGFALGGVVDANGIAGLPNSIVPAFTGLNIVTPEPSTYALAALGLGGLLFLRRK